MTTYADRCKAAATSQGLDPVTAALDEAGIAYEVEQTGGFCMTVTVTHANGTLGITAETTADGDDDYFVGSYPGTSWHDGPDGEGEPTYSEALTLAEVVAQAAAAGRPETPTVPTLGTRFTKTESRPYTEAGERGVHTITTLNEVTSTDPVGFEYRTVEVVAESGRPSFAGMPAGGSVAWFGWDAALAAGRVSVVG